MMVTGVSQNRGMPVADDTNRYLREVLPGGLPCRSSEF